MFGDVFKAEGMRIITTLPRTPRMNVICERVIGPLRCELLDRIRILGVGEYLSITTLPDHTSLGAGDLQTLKRYRPGTQPISQAWGP